MSIQLQTEEGVILVLTEQNEQAMKLFLDEVFNRDREFTVIETGEVLKLNDIFDYERN